MLLCVMESGWVASLSVFSFLAGLLLIGTAAPPVTSVSLGELSGHMGETVKVTAEVASVRRARGHTFLTLGDGTPAVVFASTASRLPPVLEISRGDILELEGEVTLYEGEAELVVRGLDFVA